eukprot:3540703-Heterocapsa_arctica.AAC.1
MLIVVGGSPCQQLTKAGKGEGKVGLCGVESSNFFIFPLVCWIIQKIRPDVTVHPVVENAGSMLPHHLAAIKRCLGFRNHPEGAPLIDSKNWCHFNRKRFFISTLPSGKDRGDRRQCVASRMKPWDQGWSPCIAGSSVAS